MYFNSNATLIIEELRTDHALAAPQQLGRVPKLQPVLPQSLEWKRNLSMKLESNDLEHGKPIPEGFVFAVKNAASRIALSQNRNPHLMWSDVPAGTQSFVLICHDPDVPSKPDDVNQEGKVVPADLPRVDFYHWLLVNIPSEQHEIEQGSHSNGVTPRGKPGPYLPQSLAASLRHGMNDYTAWFAGDKDMAGEYHGYDGPCPPWNDTIVHRYVFTVRALDIPCVPLGERFRAADVLSAIKGHVLAEASLCGTYTLNPRLDV
ncbi:hypothetical protein SAMN05192563_104334 [Paraburkholderia aspalathi]|uniref:Phospholipid-binding protein, PBP family n=2 Tax=Paraburkholderia aspalathi TaxID=1324617 RepID=A0A1I7EPQ7_9BURK|nr:hypothetical protein SAMN05192563_104334 [Paraburkholderia aspalathi]